MSVQPFTSLKMADDFFSIYLNTGDADGSTGNNKDPTWLYRANQGILDRYKGFKRCFGVVDFVNIPRADALPTSLLGSTIVLRMKQNTQPNSFESTTVSNVAGKIILLEQTNIIYMCNARQLEGTETTAISGVAPPTNTGFPFEVCNPFGPMELCWTATNDFTAIDMGNTWSVKMTYYFYKEW